MRWLYEMARDPELGSAAVRVGLLFGTFFKPEAREMLQPSYDWLTKHGHMSRTTLAKAIKQLEKGGYIKVDRFHRYQSNYRPTFSGNAAWERKTLSPENGL